MEPTMRMKEADESWSDEELKALIKTRTTLHVMSRRKLTALLQWQELDALVNWEARRTVRK